MDTLVTSRDGDGSLQLAKPGARERVLAMAAEMLERARWPRERILAHRRERLRDLVRHAVARSPYYRETIGGAADGEIELRRLPVLTKSVLMREFDRIVTDPRLTLAEAEAHLGGTRAAEPMLGEYRILGSGGTTGQRGIVPYDQAAWETLIASMVRIMAAQEITPGSRVIGIGAPTPLHMSNRLFAELRAGRSDAPRLAVTTPIPEVVEALNAYRPDVILTYPSFIRPLAEEARAGRLRIAPKRFGTGAETLTDDIRALARAVFDAPVGNVYAATEGGLMATDCAAGGLHVLDDLVIIEVVDEGNEPVPPGVTGEKVLVTSLFNRGFPIIRYELSDLVAVAEGACGCGRSQTRLVSVSGRREDVLDLPARGGGRVNAHAFLLGETLLHLPAVRQYQLCPRADGLTVRVVLGAGASTGDVLPAAERALRAELDRLGAAVDVLCFESVPEIPRAGTGAKERVVSRTG